jgi:hypothetical protein
MPRQYEAIRDKLVSQGKSLKEAKALAAKIYNARRGSKPPVGPNSDKPKRKK